MHIFIGFIYTHSLCIYDLVYGDNKNTDTASQKYFIEILQLCFCFLSTYEATSQSHAVHVKKARMMVFITGEK